MSVQNKNWPKKITVDKRIVRILSGSTYTNFPSAIREIITNSYDADAENVRITIDLKNEIISILDDGKGMTEEDFAFYLRIAGKTRKKENSTTQSKRKVIGQFGVGFLSVLPFCEKYTIETKKKGTSQIVYATIASNEYFNDKAKALDVDAIPIHGGIREDGKAVNEQYTRIRLIGFSALTRSFFNSDYTIKSKKTTILNWPPLALLEWQLREYLPLSYKNDTVGKKLNEIFSEESHLEFNVTLNGEKLFRNVHAKNIVDYSENIEKLGDIRFKYVIMTSYEPITPTEARYMLIRNLNVGVGERTTFGLGLEGKVYAKLAHLTGELHVFTGINDLISVSRDKFNFSIDFERLKEFVRNKLAHWANELDTIQNITKTVSELKDNRRVTDIKKLKEENVHKELDTLVSKGFEIRKDKNVSKGEIKIDRVKKEIVLASDIDEYYKSINLLGEEYKLKVDKWNHKTSFNPAVRIEKGVTLINELYPLFGEKKTFDTFLKLHLLLYNYNQENKISDRTYQLLLSDILNTFLDHD